MDCSRCGGRMNHHADKAIEPRSREEAERMDEALGGMLEELFACPNCGHVDSRSATEAAPGG